MPSPDPIFSANLEKWSTLPSGGPQRANVADLLGLDDAGLAAFWEQGAAKWNAERGWEYARFAARFAGRNVLEVGSGLGHDGLVLARSAARWTFCDILEQNLRFIERMAAKLGAANVATRHLCDPLTHDFGATFDAFWAHGVLHHVPFATAQREFANIDRYLAPGAVAGVLMYPRERWEQAGRPSFETFGQTTDGPGTPWAEWYDEQKILELFGARWELVEAVRWGHRQSEFITFEMVRKADEPGGGQ